METYEYVAVAADGARVHGIQTATDEIALDVALDNRGLVLTSAALVTEKRASGRAKLTRDELVTLTTQLATVTSAGVPIVEGLEGIGRRLESPSGQALVEHMVADLRGGNSLSGVMEPFPKVFPQIYTASIRAGENAGALDRILNKLASYLEWARAMRATAMQALIYPAILMAAICGLIAILLLFVLPKIMGLFPEGGDLPWQTEIVLAVSNFLREHLLLVGLAVTSAAIGVIGSWRSPTGRRVIHSLLLRIPKFGPLMKKIAMSRFASTASTLQGAGCDVFTVLSIASETCGNASISAAFDRSVARIRRGKTMSEALESEPEIDPLLIQMVHVGEQSGALDIALDKLAHYYDEEIPRAVKRFLSYLEPCLLLGSGGIVVFILLAAILPLFQLYDNI